MMQKSIKKNSLKAWWLAIRPRTLSAAVAPVAVACGLAMRDEVFRWQAAVICLLFALLSQIVSNLANDYFDYRKGSDTGDRLGPHRAVTEGWITPKTMWYVTLGLLALDALVGLLLVQ